MSMNVFKEMLLSVYDFKSYERFLKNRKTKVFFFGVLLFTLYFTVVVLGPLIKLQITSGGIKTSADRLIPDFELSDDTLWIERPVKLSSGTSLFYVDTDTNFELDSSLKKYMRSYSQVILMDSEKFIVKDQGEVNQLYYSDMGMEPHTTYSRENLFEYLPYVYLIIAILLILIYIIMAVLFFLGALVVALLGMVVASCMSYQLTFGQLYILALYSRTLPLLLKALLSFLPVGIPFFWIINFGISLIYISRAINRLKEHKLMEPLEFSSDRDNFN